MIKEEDYLEENMEHLGQMDVIADEITIGSDRFLHSANSRAVYGVSAQQLQPIILNQKASQSCRIVVNSKEINSNPSTLKVIKIPTKGTNQIGGSLNKPLRIITIPKGQSLNNSSKTMLISGSSIHSNQLNNSAGNQMIKLATPEGRVVHVKTVANSGSKPGTFIIARMPQGATSRAVSRAPDGSTRQVILTQKSNNWALSDSNGVLQHPLSDQQQQHRDEKVPQHLMSSSLARALTLSPGSFTPGLGVVGPLVQSGGHHIMDMDMGGDSGDEATLAYNAALKSNGLRKYAQSVCQKVRDKGVTSYNEVADELVQEYAAENPMIPQDQLQYHQKNIRRRVYDALNVLMAMQIITKEKKEIRWVGLPINAMQEKKRLEGERDKRMATFKEKVQEVEELILQLVAHKSLIARNRCHERVYGLPHDNAVVELPFTTIFTNKKTVINCYISDDKTNYLLNFDQPFEMHDHVDTLRAMGLNLNLGSDICSENEYQQCLELVPTALRFYVEAMYERRPPIEPDLEAVHEQRRSYLEAKLAAAASGSIYISGRNSSSVGNIFHDGGLLHNQHSIHNTGYSHDICDDEDDDLQDLDVDNDMESDDDRGRSETDAELGVS